MKGSFKGKKKDFDREFNKTKRELIDHLRDSIHNEGKCLRICFLGAEAELLLVSIFLSLRGFGFWRNLLIFFIGTFIVLGLIHYKYFTLRKYKKLIRILQKEHDVLCAFVSVGLDPDFYDLDPFVKKTLIRINFLNMMGSAIKHGQKVKFEPSFLGMNLATVKVRVRNGKIYHSDDLEGEWDWYEKSFDFWMDRDFLPKMAVKKTKKKPYFTYDPNNDLLTIHVSKKDWKKKWNKMDMDGYFRKRGKRK